MDQLRILLLFLATVSGVLSASDGTTELTILGGVAPKVHVKPSLKAVTSLRAGTGEVLIDPVENHNLKILNLVGELNAVPENIHNLRSLEILNLCGNNFQYVSLDSFRGMSRLAKLNLGHNRIDTVSSTIDINLPALTELLLHGNKLRTLDLTRLQADKLERLYVSENQLKQIDGFPQLFPSLVRTDLFGNKWNCAWLNSTLQALGDVETLSYLPKPACNDAGTVKVASLECE
ncbi:leucine-rich repeat-containing protein 19-like [Sabethes cyaneus]|uniref:leucine-rich repeat-containing protein 19-like n=1 Tax=Sabethes cyaneus TaxID=53552 RepID=UPI00237EB8BB|nr:leucine-rich repeat-containing protein 19-like [Sabethes cyaneus]